MADGAGIGSGGFWTDTQNSGSIEAGQGSSSGADSVNVEHGDADGKSGNLRVIGGLDLAFDERDVGRGASHIEGNDALNPLAVLW